MRSTAGGSAQREFERRRDRRFAGWRENRVAIIASLSVATVVASLIGQSVLGAWWLGPFVVVMFALREMTPTPGETAYRRGAEGERAVGRAIDGLPGTRSLHDRGMPRSRANLDHVLIAPNGVWTVDAKAYKGKLEVRGRGMELWIKGRNRSKLLDQARRQQAAVEGVLASAGMGRVPVRAALCFVGTEWPLLFRPKAAGSVRLTSPRRLRDLVDGPAILSPSDIHAVHAVLEGGLRPLE